MYHKYFVPVIGQIYRNRNGSDYRCTGNAAYPDDIQKTSTVDLGEHQATMIRLTDGWAIKVQGIHQFEDGTVEWKHSIGGTFQCESLAQCSEFCKKHGTSMAKYFEYLDRLRDSSETNMLGATPYLQREFVELRSDRDAAATVLQAWMGSYSEYKGGADA